MSDQIPTRSVAPGLVVGGENPQVAAPDKLLIVHFEQRIRRRQELRMKYNLQSIRMATDELASNLYLGSAIPQPPRTLLNKATSL